MHFCNNLTRLQSNRLYTDALKENNPGHLRALCKDDLFFLLTMGFNRFDINRDWLYECVREVEKDPDGMLDLWAREHYKSTIITYGLSIQDILNDPEVTIGIFSHTRPIAKGFLDQIKRELEGNEFLKKLFSDILFAEPHKTSPRWSLDNGIIVNRKSNPKEATVEAWGLVDGQPTSKHFSRLVYDDVVTRESVTTPEMIEKVTEAWALSLNLGSHDGKRRHIGTRYHFNDTYRAIIARGAARPRIKPATEDGTVGGKPVFLSQEALEEKRDSFGPYVFACQMLQNPVADNAMGFKLEWLVYYDILKNTDSWNFFVLCDPASEKKKTSDYTVIACVGLAPDNNYYLVDAIRDRLNLAERTNKVFEFVRKWNPVAVGYEKYGMQSDIEHMHYIMNQENYRFKIVPLGGSMRKEDRIRRLVPIFSQTRFYLPHRLLFTNYEGRTIDFVNAFVNDEFLAFPVAVHDDMLDCVSRIVDPGLGAKFPERQATSRGSILLEKDIDVMETEYDLFS